MTFDEAAEFCKQRNGYLVTVTSKEENDFLASLISYPGTDYGEWWVWLGLTDREEEGNFRWITGEEFTYSNWHYGEPNNLGGNEDCVMFGSHYTYDKWNDYPCTGRAKRIVCERGTGVVEKTEVVKESDVLKKLRDQGIELSNPTDIFGRDIAGISAANAQMYKTECIFGITCRLADYISPAASWEDVARSELMAGQENLNVARQIGYFKNLKEILDIAYVVASLAEVVKSVHGLKASGIKAKQHAAHTARTAHAAASLKGAAKSAPVLHEKLRRIATTKELLNHKKTIVEFADSMATIYEAASMVDRATSSRARIPRVNGEIMMLISAALSEGLSVPVDLANKLFPKKKAESYIDYYTSKGTAQMAAAYHAQEMHEISIKDHLSDEDIKEYFSHAEEFIKLKILGTFLDDLRSRSTWKENPDLVVKIGSFMAKRGIGTSPEKVLEAELRVIQDRRYNYESAQGYLEHLKRRLGIS